MHVSVCAPCLHQLYQHTTKCFNICSWDTGHSRCVFEGDRKRAVRRASCYMVILTTTLISDWSGIFELLYNNLGTATIIKYTTVQAFTTGLRAGKSKLQSSVSDSDCDSNQ